MDSYVEYISYFKDSINNKYKHKKQQKCQYNNSPPGSLPSV